MAGVAAFPQLPVLISVVGNPPAFRVSQSSILPRLGNPNLPAMFHLCVDKPDAPPLPGEYSVEGGALMFRPKYPLEPGVGYRAAFSLLNERAEFQYTIPKPVVVPTTTVDRIYPSTASIPENQLKFYVHFSAPMSKGEAAKRLHLIEEGAGEVKLPFLEIAEELWDREFKRLTILFDPGRIKRGLVPNQEVGMALKEGRKYTLVVDAAWPDAKGAPLKTEFRKAFAAAPADRTPLEPKTWKLLGPSPMTREAVVLDFPEPLDAALLLRFIDVADSKGGLVKGSVAMDNDESRWIFTPAEPWAEGKYSLEVLAGLEDLAGNRVGRAFDVDKFDEVSRQPAAESHSIPFTVGTAPAPVATPAPAPAPPKPAAPKRPRK